MKKRYVALILLFVAACSAVLYQYAKTKNQMPFQNTDIVKAEYYYYTKLLHSFNEEDILYIEKQLKDLVLLGEVKELPIRDGGNSHIQITDAEGNTVSVEFWCGKRATQNIVFINEKAYYCPLEVAENISSFCDKTVYGIEWE